MSGRALVQFDGYNNIGWYDIDLSFLKVVDAPLPKPEEKPAKKAKEAAPKAEKPAAEAKPAQPSPPRQPQPQASRWPMFWPPRGRSQPAPPLPRKPLPPPPPRPRRAARG